MRHSIQRNFHQDGQQRWCFCTDDFYFCIISLWVKVAVLKFFWLLWRHNVLSFAFTDTRVEADYNVIALVPRNTVHIIGDLDPGMACEMDFQSSNDGLQWIEYRTALQEGYEVSLNEAVIDQFDQFDLVILNPYVTAAATHLTRMVCVWYIVCTVHTLYRLCTN